MTVPTRRYVLALFLVLQALDVLTTAAGLRNGAVEANPAAAWLLAVHGELAVYAVKALIVAGVVALVLATERFAPRVWHALRICNVLYVLVVAVNATAIV